jgi:predicted nucleic acid-binding protein
MKKPISRLYLDTSIYGGVFDDEFKEDSKRIMDAINDNKICVLMSDIVVAEIEAKGTPEKVQELVRSIPLKHIEALQLTAEVSTLQQAYLDRKILTARSKNDAAHVAFATVHRADAIVSWNFRDIVRFDRMKLFNQVNFSLGYGLLTIVSPKEVFFDE